MAFKIRQQLFKFNGLIPGKKYLRSVDQIQVIGVLLPSDAGDRSQIEGHISDDHKSKQSQRSQFIG